MRKLLLTKGATVRDGKVSRVKILWPAMAARLMQFKRTSIPVAQYHTLSVDEKLALKNSFGFFIGGWFKDGSRKRDQLVARCVLTLDIDYLDAWDLDALSDRYAGFAHATHTTMSHTPDKPKLRIVFPLKRDVTVDEYEPLARKVGSWFDINAVDKVSYRPAQLMYLPAVCSDGEILCENVDGEWLDPDAVLASYTDWKDNFEWPVADKDCTPRPSGVHAENPLTKPGIIGAFCRAYSVPEAIEAFQLPYSPTEHPDRYTPDGASGSQGAVIYDDGLFIYSHHSNDVASNKNLNAWDLVRLVKFGEMDKGLPEGTPLAKLPSQKEMTRLAGTDTRVRHGVAVDEFDDLGPLPETEPAPTSEPDTVEPETIRSNLTFDGLLREIEAAGTPAEDVTPERCKKFLTSISAAKLEPTDNVLLLRAVQRLGKLNELVYSLESLKEELKVCGKRLSSEMAGKNGVIRDVEEDLIGEVLNEHYAGGKHIKRMAGSFWTYNKGLWARDDDERILGLLSRTLIRLRKDRPETVLELVAAVGESKTSSLAKQLRDMLTTTLAAKESRDDPLKMLRRFPLPVINCLNKELTFDIAGNVTVGAHAPEHFHTVRIDAVYDPAATAPTWDNFCASIFSETVDPEGAKRHLEEVCGYAIQMSRWLKCWVLLQGPTNTGKTTVADVLKSLLGGAVLERELQSYASANRSNFAESDLIGKLLLVDDDQAKGALLPDGLLKKISEEKPITCELKFGATIMFVSRAMPMMCSNHWPATRDLSDALRERAVVFPFNRPFPASERSDVLKNKMLFDEKSGILNRFIAGISRLRARGGWDFPVDAQNAVYSWVAHSNPLSMFVERCLTVDRSTVQKKRFVSSATVWNAYVGWCMDNVPDRRFRLAKHAFYDQMAALGFTRTKDAGGKYTLKFVTAVSLDDD